MFKTNNIKFFTFFLLMGLSFLSYPFKFLTLSDIHYALPTSVEHNETDDALWDAALQKIKELSSTVDFILFLGDIPEHKVKNAEEKSNIEAKIFHDLFRIDPGKPIFYVPGNNDSLLGNYQPFSHHGSSPLENAPEWDGATCAYCNHLLIDTSLLREKGYYSSYVVPNNKNIVLIVLNATQFTDTPWWLPSYPHQDKDATEQLDWLSQQLKLLKTKQLLIAMHEPLGVNYKNQPIWKKKYLAKFIQLLKAAEKNHTEITLLAAHSHYDEIRKITLPSGTSIFSYSTPAISPNHKNNPGMKLFYLSNHLKIKNFITYFTPNQRTWANDSYDAINSSNSIFPHCKTKHLSDCLNSLNPKEVCHHLETQFIYGVKNRAVIIKNCLNSYVIN